MTHQMLDMDIDQVFLTQMPYSRGKELVVLVEYMAPTEETFYTRQDLEYMLKILDGLEKGVKRV